MTTRCSFLSVQFRPLTQWVIGVGVGGGQGDAFELMNDHMVLVSGSSVQFSPLTDWIVGGT